MAEEDVVKLQKAREGMRKDDTYPCNTCPHDNNCSKYCKTAEIWFRGKDGWKKTIKPYVATLKKVNYARARKALFEQQIEAEKEKRRPSREKYYWHEKATGKLRYYDTALKLLKEEYKVPDDEIEDKLFEYFVRTTSEVVFVPFEPDSSYINKENIL